MDAFRLCLAFGPVAIYLLLLGAINLSRRPFLVSGGRDAAVLGLAVSGFVIVGPIELFFPHAAANVFGPYIWLFLLVLYGLGLVLVLLLLRPRLIIYNITVDQLRPILADLVERLDSDARWAGDALTLPNLGVQLFIDNLPNMRNVSLVSAGANQSHLGWRRLEAALTVALRRVEMSRNPRGLSLIGTAAIIVVGIVTAIARNPEAVAEALFDMLRM